MRIFLFLIMFLTFWEVVHSQSVLQKALTTETFPEYDSYIKKYAPSDSALRVVDAIANRQHYSNRSAVAREVFITYRPYFRVKDLYFKQVIEMYEGYMLTQTATPDIFQYYENFIRSKAPSEEAFVAVQRISDNFINQKKWDSAIVVFEHFKPFFPNMEKRFNTIIEILRAPEEGLVVRNLGKNINTSSDEWDPNPTPDGKYLFFSTSNRPDSYGGTDVFVSTLENGIWEKAKNVGRTINGP